MEPPSYHPVAILNESGRRAPRALLQRAVAAALSLYDIPDRSISLLLCDDATMQSLNRRFRQVDEPTDVLTFSSADIPGAPLGDIAISVPYAERQAKARGVSLSQELGYLAIHGTLHLVGLDDESEEDRREMVQVMNLAARSAGLEPDENWASILHGVGSS